MELTLFIIGTLLAIIGVLGLRILDKLEGSISQAVKSVSELNERVAKVITAIEYHDERIKRLEDKT
jgi:hypothetical protein